MKKNNKHNDFERNECLIAKYLNDVFKEQIPDEDIPKPDLSFMYAEDVDAANTAGLRAGVKKKRRFVAVRRVAAAFCAICAIFVVSSGMTVMLSEGEAYAGNPIISFFGRSISYIILGPVDEEDYSDESYDSKKVFERSDISIIKKDLPEMMLVGYVPERYKFDSLKLEEYGTGHFSYTYEYKNPEDTDDLICITGQKRDKKGQLILFGSNIRINYK